MSDSAELTPEQRADWEATLSGYMSNLSEAYWCAGWMSGLTESLIEACAEVQKTGQLVRHHGYFVSPADCEIMLYMVNKLGYWMDFDGPYQGKESEITPEFEDCQECDGDGMVECDDCDGQGTYVDGEQCEECMGTGMVDCGYCGGEGLIEVKP